MRSKKKKVSLLTTRAAQLRIYSGMEGGTDRGWEGERALEQLIS